MIPRFAADRSSLTGHSFKAGQRVTVLASKKTASITMVSPTEVLLWVDGEDRNWERWFAPGDIYPVT
jgi:hypothetical protein